MTVRAPRTGRLGRVGRDRARSGRLRRHGPAMIHDAQAPLAVTRSKGTLSSLCVFASDAGQYFSEQRPGEQREGGCRVHWGRSRNTYSDHHSDLASNLARSAAHPRSGGKRSRRKPAPFARPDCPPAAPPSGVAPGESVVATTRGCQSILRQWVELPIVMPASSCYCECRHKLRWRHRSPGTPLRLPLLSHPVPV